MKTPITKSILLACLILAALGAHAAATATNYSSAVAAPPRGSGETRVHDPSTILKAGDAYWLFSTGTGIISRRSKDLVNWTDGPRVFDRSPDWVADAVPENRGHFWAPDVLFLTNRYLLYYSVSSFGKKTSAIALATNPTLDPGDSNYAWTDHGIVVSTTTNSNHNAIDPSLLLDRDGRLWMAYGSYWSGIKLMELDPQTGMRIATNSPLHALAWNESIEAAGLHRRGDHYYLFLNWGKCCRGTNSTYEIRVGRSASITGPYVDRDGKHLMKGGGTLFLETAGYRIGPGHAAFLQHNGKEYLSYHYYHGEHGGRPTLGIISLNWTADGWPEAGAPLTEPIQGSNR
jgi:arabinan endo-1,5-alpha-L-arabinosidase